MAKKLQKENKEINAREKTREKNEENTLKMLSAPRRHCCCASHLT
jgi:hypothetical protein